MTVSLRAPMAGAGHDALQDADPRHQEAGAHVLLGAMLSQAA